MGMLNKMFPDLEYYQDLLPQVYQRAYSRVSVTRFSPLGAPRPLIDGKTFFEYGCELEEVFGGVPDPVGYYHQGNARGQIQYVTLHKRFERISYNLPASFDQRL
jgi:hypothetical protein